MGPTGGNGFDRPGYFRAPVPRSPSDAPAAALTIAPPSGNASAGHPAVAPVPENEGEQ